MTSVLESNEHRNSLPRLLDRRQLADELNIKLASAETIMRGCPIVKVGRRCYVTEEAVAAYLRKAASTP